MDSDDIQHKRGDLIWQINNLIVNVGESRHTVTQKIIYSQCSHLYGSMWIMQSYGFVGRQI